MKNVIITFGVGYSFNDIKYFIQSCIENSPDTEVYIFVGANINELRNHCNRYSKIRLIRYHEPLLAKVITKTLMRFDSSARVLAKWLRFVSLRRLAPSGVTDSLTLPLVQFMVKRFFLIKNLLRSISYDQVMLTDIRDVLILSDPFATLKPNSIISGEEPVRISESEMNSKWLMKTYSTNELEDIKDFPVVCAGVTIGTKKAIDQYITEMIKDTYQCLPNIINMLGADQAIHMMLFYKGLKGLDKNLESNGSGTIATLHFSTLKEFYLEDRTMKNSSGQSLAVVHQYDRHEKLKKYLIDLFEQNQPDPAMIP